MSEQLGITKRALAEHRRKQRFPNCWVKNGRVILWHVAETVEAWRRGLP